jgi:predicted nucleic acid-binding Zn ribbon protein
MESIQDLLHPVAARLLRPAPLSDEKVLCAWRLAVGAALARVARPRLSDRGVLHVALDDARWKPDIDRSRALILERLQSVLGDEVVRSVTVSAPRAAPAPPRPSGQRASTRRKPSK